MKSFQIRDVSSDEEILAEYKKLLEAKVAEKKPQQDQETEADCNPSTSSGGLSENNRFSGTSTGLAFGISASS